MKTLEILADGIAVEAVLADESVDSVRALGVQVEFHPGISTVMHSIVLEATLRRWQRQVGAVRRGARPSTTSRDAAWLSGWTLQAFDLEGAVVVGMRIAYRHGDEEEAVESAG